MSKNQVLDDFVRAGFLLSSEINFNRLVSILVEQAADQSRSNLACLYLYSDPEMNTGPLRLVYRRGLKNVPSKIPGNTELMDFVEECGESVVLSAREGSPFDELFLDESMNSGIVLPLKSGKRKLGALFLNSRNENHYKGEKFFYLDAVVKLAGGMLENSRLLKELKEYLAKIESLEKYQESIFNAMTNLLVTTDSDGKIKYFNPAASVSLNLSGEDTGENFNSKFRDNISSNILETVSETIIHKKEIAGIEGIFRRKNSEEMDYSLNIAPIYGAAKKYEGAVLLFTDQSRERELKEKVKSAVEQRRQIKDMFSRYLSKDIVKNITDNPDLVRPGGDKKTATVFFADITGYTAFSEGKDPQYIIEVLNGFFSEAVELIIKNKGYIDKFIGDCIMAAWGVPTQTEEHDAVQAVTTALEIHEMVRSADRDFFRGDASNLKISIGMASGPLVAGNVGSDRRMDYTVLGDTVNTAARLEGVASAEEVIITRATRDLIGDRFKLEERPPVKVKGKEKPLEIFNVKGIIR